MSGTEYRSNKHCDYRVVKTWCIECPLDKYKHLYPVPEGGGITSKHTLYRPHSYSPAPPWLEHFCFSLGNQIFFICIEDVDGQLQTPTDSSHCIHAASLVGGIPCVIQVKEADENWHPVTADWGLIHAQTRQTVDPPTYVTPARVEISDWELRIAAWPTDWCRVVRHLMDTPQNFFKKVRSRDSGTHKYFSNTKEPVTTMVVFLISEDEERWSQDLHRTTDASVCVVTKDKKQKVMGWKDSHWVQVLTDWCLFQPFDLHRCE